MFSCEFCTISKNTFSYRTPLVAASVHRQNQVESSAKVKKDTPLPQAPCKNRVDTAHQNDLLNPNASDTAEAQMQAQNTANLFPLISPTYPHRKLEWIQQKEFVYSDIGNESLILKHWIINLFSFFVFQNKRHFSTNLRGVLLNLQNTSLLNGVPNVPMGPMCSTCPAYPTCPSIFYRPEN